MQKNKTLLLTGAYGLVGSNICKVLERDYPDIQITKVKCDELGYYFAHNFHYVIHAAGYGQPQMFGKDKAKTIEINTFYTDALFSSLRPDGKFLFVSSSEVYSGAPSPHKETDIGTTTPQHPRACYIEGKRCGEAICMAYKEQGYDVKIARLALAYGPGTKKGDARVLNQFIEQALTTRKIKMKDDGSDLRFYLYVENAAQMILDILFKGKDVVYNVAGIDMTSIKGLAERISEIIGCKVYEGDKKLEGSPSMVGLDINKALKEFEYKNSWFVNLHDGIKRTIEYQKQLYGIN